jgi:TetR/AcrR family transcriptional regulator
MGVQERKQREREQRRKVILDSARRAFVAHGMQHTSMDRIAEEAELSKGTLYLYYRNRDDLLLTLIVDDLEKLIKKMESVAKGKQAPDARMLKAIHTFHQFATKNEFFYKAITQVSLAELFDCRDEESEAVQRFRELNQRLFQSMKVIVDDGVNDGTFHLETPSSYVVIQMILAIKGTIVILSNGMIPPDWMNGDLDQILTDQVKMFIRGMKSPLPKNALKSNKKAKA